MKRINVVVALFASLSFLGCQETKEDQNNPASEKDTYKKIGEEIPFETGMQWIDLYKKRVSQQGRTELLSSYNVSADQVNNLLQSTQNLVGIAFHYGLDEAGEKHILLIPVDESLTLWSSGTSERNFVDANTGNEIDGATASGWAENYKNENPDAIWFHFFGKTVFEQMSALPYFNSVEIEPAINSLDFTPQLLLVVLNDDLISFGRTANPPGTVYDASNACPPCAVQ